MAVAAILRPSRYCARAAPAPAIAREDLNPGGRTAQAGMTQFKGTHLVRRDGKGRVSIPAAFRAVLRGDHPANGVPVSGPVNGAVVLRPSHKYDCVEGWHPAQFEAQGNQIQQLPRFSDEEDDLALALYSDAVDAEPDKEGRIVLPRDLADHAKLGEEVAFVGAGNHFQIWEPQAAQRRVAEARERARVLRMTLPAAIPAAIPAGGGK